MLTKVVIGVYELNIISKNNPKAHSYSSYPSLTVGAQ